jgi:hypothetical protein
MFRRLLLYVNRTLHSRKVGWGIDDKAYVGVHLFTDAEVAGCMRTDHCKSGECFFMGVPETFFFESKPVRETSLSLHSTHQAEIVAVDLAVRTFKIPSLSLWDQIETCRCAALLCGQHGYPSALSHRQEPYCAGHEQNTSH